MESVVNLIFSVENIRMLVMLAFGTCGFVWIKNSLLKAVDEKIANSRDSLYNQLKENDFRHLNDTIGTLTFMLEKNKFLSSEDRNFIGGRL